MKEKAVLELQKLSEEIRKERERMAREVRDAGMDTQEALDRVMRACLRAHQFLFLLPERLIQIGEDLKK